MSNDFIDLGKQDTIADKPVNLSGDSKMHYPTIYIGSMPNGEDGLESLPDDVFEFVGKGRVIRYTEDIKNGTCSCEIEVHGIKPTKRRAKSRKSTEESLDDAFEKISRGKENK